MKKMERVQRMVLKTYHHPFLDMSLLQAPISLLFLISAGNFFDFLFIPSI